MRALLCLLLSTIVSTRTAWAGGTLRIDSDTPGQKVLIDGEDLGLITPAVVPALKAGPHTIQVFDTCRSGEARATVRDGKATDVMVDTKELPATSPSVSPEGATVTVDGSLITRAAATVLWVPFRAGHVDDHTPIVVSVEPRAERSRTPVDPRAHRPATLTVEVNVTVPSSCWTET